MTFPLVLPHRNCARRRAANPQNGSHGQAADNRQNRIPWDQPAPGGVEKLTATGVYRVRVGDYGIIYDIVDKVTTVLVLKVGDRKDVYKR